MADIQLTVDAELLKGLFEKSDGVAKLLEQVLNEILEVQVTEALGARRHERTSERRGYRNGYRTPLHARRWPDAARAAGS